MIHPAKPDRCVPDNPIKNNKEKYAIIPAYG